MPSRESQKPDNIPDMTLPERTMPPPEPTYVPDMTLPDKIELKPSANAPPPWAKPPAAVGGWKVGDRVLAPWEPMFLYAGTIQEVRAGKALVQFDDGDAGWLFADQLQPLAVKHGQKVLSRKNMGPLFFPGQVLQVRADEVLVGFEDGSREEWTRVAALRIVREEPGDGAQPTKVESNRDYLDHLRRGDRVWAPWTAEAFFAGTIDSTSGGEAHIHFDDGDQGWVRLDQLLPLVLTVGMRVLGHWQNRGQFYPGTIDKVVGEKIRIHYDDGDEEWTRPAALALPRIPSGPAARPTKTVSHYGQAWRWLLPIGISIAFLVLRSCR